MGDQSNGSLSAVEMPERSAELTEPQPVEEEILVADNWEELDAAYKMEPDFVYDEQYGESIPPFSKSSASSQL